MIFNFAIFLTLLRIAAIPLMALFFYWDMSLAAAIIFGLAGVTDWADGYVARKYNQSTQFGAFLDPIADKLIVMMAVLLIVEREASVWITTMAAIIIGREIIITALREWMAQSGLRGKVAVGFTGKLKTTAQIFALIFLLYNQSLWGLPLREIGYVLLILSTILAVVSMVQYLSQAYKAIKS